MVGSAAGSDNAIAVTMMSKRQPDRHRPLPARTQRRVKTNDGAVPREMPCGTDPRSGTIGVQHSGRAMFLNQDAAFKALLKPPYCSIHSWAGVCTGGDHACDTAHVVACLGYTTADSHPTQYQSKASDVIDLCHVLHCVPFTNRTLSSMLIIDWMSSRIGGVARCCLVPPPNFKVDNHRQQESGVAPGWAHGRGWQRQR